MTKSQSNIYEAGCRVYSDEWYDAQVEESLNSARILVNHLWPFIQPNAVLDVGCGRGAWLTAWKEKGTRILCGYDGPWNSQEDMIDDTIEFQQVDLNQQFSSPCRVDLCMTLEVAEHLLPKSAEGFVRSLTNSADTVLFGAAYTGQGGTNHINEQPPTYWSRHFEACGFVPFDAVRPIFWTDERVSFWYRQNTFLYAKEDSESFHRLIARGLTPIPNIGFMDCVHPALYSARTGANVGFKEHLRQVAPSFVRAMKKRIHRR